METDNAGAVQAVYAYGNDMISMKRADVNSFYLYDGLGSTRQLTADDESVAASYTYDSFGNVVASSGSVNNVYGFTGEQQFNEADDLVFLRARYYEPKSGRFISRDPIHYVGGMNLYAYVKNNPTVHVDALGTGPIGKIKWCLICAIELSIWKNTCVNICRHICDSVCESMCTPEEMIACAECKRDKEQKCMLDCIAGGRKTLKSCLKCAGELPM